MQEEKLKRRRDEFVEKHRLNTPERRLELVTHDDYLNDMQSAFEAGYRVGRSDGYGEALTRSTPAATEEKS